MPWSASDALGHTKKANTPKKRHKWASIANAVLKDTGNEGRAIRIANSRMHEDVLQRTTLLLSWI